MIDPKMKVAIQDACKELRQPEAVGRLLTALVENLERGPLDSSEKRRSLELILQAIVRETD
jgi:hypothetical protein